MSDSTVSQESSPQESSRTTQFLRLLSECDQQLSAYILALVLSIEDADEIVQNTKLKLWEQFERYEPGTDFAAWARTVGYYEVLSFRQKRRSAREMNTAFLDAVAEQAALTPPNQSRRRIALDACLSKLDTGCREFVLRCYTTGTQIAEVASEMGRPATAVYQKLWRLRKQLHQCVDRELGRS